MDNRARQNLFLLGSGGGSGATDFLPANHHDVYREDDGKEEACAQMQALMSQLEPNPIISIPPTQQPQQQPQDELLQRVLQQQQLFQQMQEQEQLMAAYQQEQQQQPTAAASSLEQVLQASSSSEVGQDQQQVNNIIIQALQQQGFDVMGLLSQQQNIAPATNDLAAVNLFQTGVAPQQQQQQQHTMIVDPFQPLKTFAPSQPSATVLEPNQVLPSDGLASAQLPYPAEPSFLSSQQQQQEIVDITPTPSVEGDNNSSERTIADIADVYAENGILGPWSATSQALLGSMAYDAAAKSGQPPCKKARSHPKKNKDKPKRPLSAYNIFFKEERQRILDSIPESVVPPVDESSSSSSSDNKPKRKRAHKPHGKIGFEDLAKQIGERWKGLDSASVDYYRELADEDSARYRAEMEVYLTKKQQQQISESSSVISDSDSDSHGASSSSITTA